MALALYDLDNTLLSDDCEHAWCEYLLEEGVLDEDGVRAENEPLYGEYIAGTLDIHESVKLQLEPLIEHPPDKLRRWRAEFMNSRIEPMITEAAVTLVEASRGLRIGRGRPVAPSRAATSTATPTTTCRSWRWWTTRSP